ncbi:HlyD family secretion protein [Hydrogenivirga caldilitoris]|uniref:HlyD family secretion protein n=1 Tax=Hydrogenivirga caldilitoris TaxID=246264 RepID=A0A497XTZ1_9AQUI|nr:efflux RND transporter periplasmic adaptor subunit [Hydrogenivirga caldilitoris]RLJ70602.1 HlyD family secretion protein [Hydrogenivirga caldilitoris]
MKFLKPSLLFLFSITTLSYALEECVVQTKEVVKAVYGSGYVRSREYVLVRSAVSGYIKDIFVDSGDMVKRGQLLAIIDSVGLKNRIEALEERIKTLRERLEPDSPFMKNLRQNVDLREENLEKAEKKYRRRLELFDKGVIPKETLEEAERLYRSARIELNMAQLKLKDTVKEMKSELASLEKEKTSLERELENYKIKSPIEGVVLKRFAEKGDYVNAISRENALVSIGSLEKKVVLNIDEELTPLVKEGQQVYITTDALPDKILEGKVLKLDLESDPTRRVVDVEVEVELPRGVPVNSVVEGNILISKLKTTVVPLEFVKDGFVTLLVNGEKRKVKINRVFKDYAEVLGYPPGTPCLSER